MNEETKQKKKVLWLPWDSANTASSRIRCFELIPYIEEKTKDIEIRIWDWDKKEATYEEFEWPDIVVFQKNYCAPWTQEFLMEFKSREKKIIFDLSDSEWYRPERVPALNNMIYRADKIVYTTEPIKEWLIEQGISKDILTCIPDRFDLRKNYPRSLMKKHEDKRASSKRIGATCYRSDITPKITIGWHGNKNTSKNIIQCTPAILNLTKRYHINFLMISNKDDPKLNIEMKDVTMIPKFWTQETWVNDILEADIVVNPRLPIEENKGKSNNKTIIAQLLGQPCVSWDDVSDWEKDIENFITMGAKGREKYCLEKRVEAEEEYDLALSADEWIKVFEGM